MRSGLRPRNITRLQLLDGIVDAGMFRKKPAGSRFEPHVFKRLKQVRDGSRTSYENVTAKHLANASDEALRNLATSWGPFQLMGYKCILLDVKIKDIRGPNGVEHGAKWINLTYGDAMRQGRYKDCFHMHNTGSPYPKRGGPKTHDPNYVPRGGHDEAILGSYHSDHHLMPANKYALLRYRIIDRCLTNSGRPYPSKEELREA